MGRIVRIALPVVLLLATFVSFTYGGDVDLCVCEIRFDVGSVVPRTGNHTVVGTDGDVFFSGHRLAVLRQFSVTMSIVQDPQNSFRSNAQVTAAHGTLQTFLGFPESTWSLGNPQPGCGNTMVFDFNPASADQNNVTGCFVLNASGGFNQPGVLVDVGGTNFDPAGLRPIRAVGSSQNFLFPPVANLTPTMAISGGNLRTDVIYTVTLTNVGTGAVLDNPGPEFTNSLPAALTLSSVTASSGSVTFDVTTNTVTWSGSIPSGGARASEGGGAVTITIAAGINPSVPLGTVISNQGQVSFDGNLDGINETTRPTDNPGTGAAGDVTSFLVGGVGEIMGIPALSETGLAALALLLGGLAILWMRRNRSREPGA